MEKIIKDYRTCLCTLAEVSWDNVHQVSLIEDTELNHRIYNFDGIAKQFCKKVRGEKNMSCDGYFEKSSKEKYFIEFKNQEEGSIDRKLLKNKIYDSITTIAMNENLRRSDLTEKINVIIVYNDERKTDKTNAAYTTSKSFNAFSEKMAELASLQGIDTYDKKFELGKEKGILFKDVYTVDKTIFEKEFVPVLFDRTDEGMGK